MRNIIVCNHFCKLHEINKQTNKNWNNVLQQLAGHNPSRIHQQVTPVNYTFSLHRGGWLLVHMHWMKEKEKERKKNCSKIDINDYWYWSGTRRVTGNAIYIQKNGKRSVIVRWGECATVEWGRNWKFSHHLVQWEQPEAKRCNKTKHAMRPFDFCRFSSFPFLYFVFWLFDSDVRSTASITCHHLVKLKKKADHKI